MPRRHDGFGRRELKDQEGPIGELGLPGLLERYENVLIKRGRAAGDLERIGDLSQVIRTEILKRGDNDDVLKALLDQFEDACIKKGVYGAIPARRSRVSREPAAVDPVHIEAIRNARTLNDEILTWFRRRH